MTNDPYKVLGITPQATDEQVKKAYRELARKYHPDNYANSPLADLAEEKMKEINEAYETIQSQRKAEREHRDEAGFEHYAGGSYGGTDFRDIRACIAARDFYEASIRLDSVAKADRNAEWHYLKGYVFYAKGWFFEAEKYFEMACRMEPGNPEFQEALQNIRRYNTNARNQHQSDTFCDVCSTLICADCLCELCGGDLIPCC